MNKDPKDKITAAQVKAVKNRKFNLPDDLLASGLTREEAIKKIIEYLRERKNKK